MSIYKKLSSIQAKLKAPRRQYNSFGKYKYRNCEDILEAVKPILTTEKCALSISDSIELIGERYYVCACVRLTDSESGDSIQTQALAREDETKKGMDGSQITGAASSYARKYALNGMFCIDDTKDADAIETHGMSEKVTQEKNEELDKLIDGMKEIFKVWIAEEKDKEVLYNAVVESGAERNFINISDITLAKKVLKNLQKIVKENKE